MCGYQVSCSFFARITRWRGETHVLGCESQGQVPGVAVVFADVSLHQKDTQSNVGAQHWLTPQQMWLLSHARTKLLH